MVTNYFHLEIFIDWEVYENKAMYLVRSWREHKIPGVVQDIIFTFMLYATYAIINCAITTPQYRVRSHLISSSSSYYFSIPDKDNKKSKQKLYVEENTLPHVRKSSIVNRFYDLQLLTRRDHCGENFIPVPHGSITLTTLAILAGALSYIAPLQFYFDL